MNRHYLTGIIALSLFSSYSPTISAQTAEISAFDTAENHSAAADRLFYDAIKARTLNNDKEAESLLLRYIEEKPRVAAAYYELARINGRANNTTKSLDYAQKATALDTGNKWYKEFYGNLLADKGEFTQAAHVFSALARQYRPNEEYNLKAALMYQKLGKYKEAIDQLEQMVDKSDPDEDILLQIQQLHLKNNNIEGAAAALKRLIDANPKEGKYYALLAEMYENNKLPAKAKEVYNEAERKFPNDISIQLGLAGYYKRLHNEDKYNEYIKKVVSNKELDAQSQLTLLISYIQESEKDTLSKSKGLEMAAQLANQYPDEASIQAVYGDLLSLNNQRDKAIVAYKKSLSIDSSSLSAWQQLLYSYTERANADSLILYSERAIALFPNQAMLYYLNGIGYSNKNNYKKAIKSLSLAVDYQPEENKQLLAEMYTSLGDAYNSNKEYEQSDASYDKALKFDPNNATVLNNYAYYLSVRGVRLDDAEKYSKRSLEIRPGEATFLDTYGWIFYKAGKYQKAKELIQQAIDKSPEDADATLYEHLGDIYYQLNNTEKAVEYWKKAKDKDPSNEQIEKKIRDRKLYE